MFGETSSRLTSDKLKLLKQSLLTFFLTHPAPSVLYLPCSWTPTWSLSFSFDSSLPLALILHYYTSLFLSLTILLSRYPLPTLSPGCFLTLCNQLSTHSLSAVLSIYLSFVAWTCRCLVTGDRFPGYRDSKSEHLSYYFRDRVALSGSEVSRLGCLCSVSHGVSCPNPKTAWILNIHPCTQRATECSWRRLSYDSFNQIIVLELHHQHDWTEQFCMLQVRCKELNLRGLPSHLKRRDSGILD